MTIHWGSLITVFAVSLGTAITVVALVTVAMLGLSARVPRAVERGTTTRSRWLLSPTTGSVLAAACLTAASLIVLFGLWAIVVR